VPATLSSDRYFKEVELTPRVSRLKEVYFRALPEVCIERARLITKYSLANGHFQKGRLSILDKARMYKSVLETRKPVVRHTQSYEKGMRRFVFRDDQLFAGSTTAKF
jgi:hypothetical protein